MAVISAVARYVSQWRLEARDAGLAKTLPALLAIECQHYMHEKIFSQTLHIVFILFLAVHCQLSAFNENLWRAARANLSSGHGRNRFQATTSRQGLKVRACCPGAPLVLD